MRPGQVLIDDQFVTSDGSVLKKYCVVLAQISTNKYILVKTTSRERRYSNAPKCQLHPNFHCYHIPNGSEPTCFSKATWIQLDEFYETEISSVIQKGIEKIIRKTDVISKANLKALLICATHSQDITPEQERILNTTISALI
ncbi:hypothetical protein [Candidatus Berkiella aquae]|uniref:PemK-like protein n=1 Tax=Candidatus Berkiella aquae TaxID=295108 RepID=A0A0Q9Z088_9GAMM|nr:hypothetical protein [Candidatus Berkiella aquae]MCS5710434.1 hypothetical protein [Candidatus Berkiella aquae]